MQKPLYLALLLVLILTMAAFAGPDQIKQVERESDLPSFIGWVPDKFIVVMQPEAGKLRTTQALNAVIHIGEPAFDQISDQFAVSNIHQQFRGTDPSPGSPTAELAKYHKIKIESGTLEEAMEAYRQHPMVEKVEPIGIHTMFATPNDPYFSAYQWYHNQANDNDIDSPEAWNIQTGSTSVTIAIMDSGTRYFHPDLGGANASFSNPGASRGNMWVNNAELNGSAGVDDDGNGYVDDWIGYDFIDGVSNCWSGEDCNTKDNDPRDFNGHGTHTAGIMGMMTNDGYGMAGVAGGWGNGTQPVTGNGVKIMPLRMGYSYNHWLYGEIGVVMMDAAAEAFYYAADNGAKVASCSWGSSNSGGIAAAADYFTANGGLIFVAAGNAGDEVAGYLNSRSDCISVAATDQNDAAASFTTYGTWVDISAPGVGIYSTYHDHNDAATNYWSSMDGTSMACPMAAAVGAMIWSQNPTWTAAQVESQLYSSADNIDAELTATYIGKMGAGRINLFNAVNTGPPPAPVAAFSGSPTSGTEPLNVNFTDQSTGSITSWSWTFGDGGSSVAQNPSYTYTTAGTYTVELTVTGPGGSDINTKVNYITVNPCVLPTAGFAGTPTSGDYPLNVSFTDQSTGATSYSWDFGDGGTSTAANPSYTYTTAGTFSVTQTVTNSCGSDPLVRTNYITVTTPPCNAPIAAFSGSPTSGTEPLTVNFTDQSTNTPTSWSWAFGDGGTSTQQNPGYVYNAAGTYTVTLTATNSCGSDQLVQTNYITVNPCVLPTAGFVGTPTSGDYPLNVSFTDQSTGAASYSWDFGDGGTSTTASPSHTYTVAGTFSVTQTVTNACGSDPLVRTNYITVTTPPCSNPVAGFTGSPTSGTAPLTVSFTDQSTNAPTSWTWDFGDGGTSTQQNPGYTYNTAGTYSVTLTATNSCGSDQLVQTNYITVNSGPVTGEGFILSRNPDFSTDDRVFDRSETLYIKLWTDQVDYNDLKKNRFELKDNQAGDKDRQPLTNHFDNTYTASYVLANLPTSGTDWTWKGEAEDNPGNRYKPSVTITVNSGPPPAPVADFSGNPTSGSAPLAVSFTDLSTNSPTSWTWDFGDGGNSTAQNPNYTYNATGTYTVSLTATNGAGSDQMIKTGYITVSTCSAPVAGFTGTPTTGNAPLAVGFTDQSTGATSWNWDFGDGGTSTAQNPNYSYGTAGTYTVTLSVSNACGSDQLVQTNYITVNDGGPVTGEGFILSRNPDFSTDDRVFDRSETLYIKMWTDQVDFNDLKRNRFELKDNQAGDKDRQPLTNHFDNTYTASYVLANLPTSGTDWTWKGEVEDNPRNRYKPSVTITVTNGVAGVGGDNLAEVSTMRNYPNPFNPTTTISFSLPTSGHVSLAVYNIVGQEVDVLVDRSMFAGNHAVEWNASGYASGIYFYRLVTEAMVETKRMILLK